MNQLPPETKALSILRSKVERYLREMIGTFEVAGDRYRIHEGSSVLIIHPFDWQENSTIVKLIAIVLREIPKAGNERMFEELNNLNNRMLFGKLFWAPDEENGPIGAILFEHNFIGEFLDYEEFRHGCMALAFTADELDDKLQAQFGGKRWIDG